MSTFYELQTAFSSTWQEVLPQVVGLVWITLLLTAGWIIASGLRSLITELGHRMKVDHSAKEVGLTPLLTRGEIKKPVSVLLGDLVYWMFIFLVVMSVVGAYGLASPKHMMDLIFGYMHDALEVVILVGASIYIAVFIHHMVLLIVSNIGLSYAKPLARLGQYVVLGLAGLSAISMLGIQTDWFIGTTHVLIISLAIAMAIAVGMGGRNLAASFLARLFKV